jgi:hypothetical protein
VETGQLCRKIRNLHLEVGVTSNVRYSCTMVQVEMCDKHEIDGVQGHCVQVRQRAEAGESRVDAAVQHHTLAPEELPQHF